MLKGAGFDAVQLKRDLKANDMRRISFRSLPAE
jgi:hypothetical protein